jgi:hypothetical protein
MRRKKVYRYFMRWLRLFIMLSGLWTMGFVVNEMPFKQSCRILVSSFVFGLVLSLTVILEDVYKKKKKMK